ncbi:MAG: ATP-binding cassette domain-containing protein, partial [Raoultibacter sp.]
QKALNGVSIEIFQGETLGIVGESGCGKSTLARTIMGVHAPTKGQFFYREEPVDLTSRRARVAYAKKVQMVFQDPYASLDPRMTVEAIISENLEIHTSLKQQIKHDRVIELLAMVGLDEEHARRYPHEFSGGQRQRIGIARALAVQPELLVCDEPISALDLSVQSQIMNLFVRLREEYNLTYLFIAHDLRMVRAISTRIAVMYLGYVVEIAESADLYGTPLHPYTIMLLQAELDADPSRNTLQNAAAIQGELSRVDKSPQSGCPFAPRCSRVQDICHQHNPTLRTMSPGHLVACHCVDD